MICKVEDCTRKAVSRGWCSKHYQRWYRNGTVELDKENEVTILYRAPGVDEETMILYRLIAGDDEFDSRCRRMLSARRKYWWGEPR